MHCKFYQLLWCHTLVSEDPGDCSMGIAMAIGWFGKFVTDFDEMGLPKNKSEWETMDLHTGPWLLKLCVL